MCNTDDMLTNSQYFQKYRLNNKKTPTDRKIACQGRWIESSRPPRAFYNGWYPIRECSFPDHQPKPGAGQKTFKDQSFRNYRVLCDICDHPDNKPPAAKDEERCKNFECLPSIIAPKGYELPKCEPSNQEIQCQPVHGNGIPNTHWRSHDVDPLTCPKLPADSRVHHYNWFRAQMDNDNKHALKRKAQRIRDCVDKYTKNNPIPKAEYVDI